MPVSPTLWAITLAGVLALFLLDFAITRKPHAVSTREAVGWSVFYIALPLLFGAWLWGYAGSERGFEFLTGYVVEKSLSVDNLFVFMLLMGALAVPERLLQRVLLIAVAGALIMRAVFIALGAVLIAKFAFTFLVFGVILLVSAWKVWRDTVRKEDHSVDVDQLAVVRLVRRVWPVTSEYHGERFTVVQDGRRALTPLAIAVVAVLGVDMIFAVDSVPVIFGITESAYLVFVTNAFALLGLRALYFLLTGLLDKIVHLGHGLALILVFIGTKLVLHWAHDVWPGVPTVPTTASMLVIVGILVGVTITSAIARRRARGSDTHPRPMPEKETV